MKAILAVSVLAVACAGQSANTTGSNDPAKITTDARGLLDGAEQDLDKLKVDDAKAKLDKAKAMLGPNVADHPDGPGLVARQKALAGRVPFAEKEAKSSAVAEAKAGLEVSMTSLRPGFEAVKTSTPSLSTLESIRKDVAEVEATLDANKALESDEGYGAEATKTRAELAEITKTVDDRWLIVASANQTKEVTAASAKVDAAVASTKNDKATARDLAVADEAVAGFDALIQAGKPISDRDPGYAKHAAEHIQRVAAAKKTTGEQRERIEIADAKARLPAERAALEGALVGLKAKTASTSAMTAVQSATKKVEETLAKAQSIEAKDAAHRKQATLTRDLVKNVTAEVETTKRRWAIAAQQRSIDQIEATAKARVDGLDKAEDAAAYDEAGAAVDAVDKALTDGKAFETDRGYAAFAKQAHARVKTARASIDTARKNMALNAQRAKLETASTNAATRITDLDKLTEDSAFTAASQAVSELQRALEQGKPLESKDPKYATQASTLRKSIAAHNKTIDAKKKQVAVTAQKSKTDTAATAAGEAVKKLDTATDDASFGAASDAIDTLKAVLDEGKPVEKKDSAYLKHATTVRQQATTFEKTIETKKKQVALTAAKAKIDAAAKTAEDAVKKLDTATDDASFAAAAAAVATLKKALEDGKPAEKTITAYLKHATAARRTASAFDKTIATKQKQVAFTSAKSALDAAAATASEAVKKLDTATDDASFTAATDAVAALRRALEQGKPTESKDIAYLKHSTTVRRAASDHERTIKTKQKLVAFTAEKAKLDAAATVASDAVKKLDTATDDASFTAANDAVAELKNALDAGKPFASKNIEFLKHTTAVRREATALEKAIVAKKKQAAITDQKTKVDTAAAAAKDAVKALDTATDVAPFTAATDAVAALKKTIEAGTATEAKDAAYKKHAAATLQQAATLERAIAARTQQVAVSAQTATVDAAAVAATEAVSKLDGATDDGTFAAAKAAVDALEKTIEDGKPTEAKDAAYKKHAANVSRQATALESKIAAKATGVAVNAQGAALDAASAAVAAALAKLEADPGAAPGATAAVKALNETLAKGKVYEAKDKAYAKAAAAERNKIAGHEMAIASRVAKANIASHRANVEAAKAALDAALQKIEGPAKHADYQAALDAVTGVKRIVEEGFEYGAGDAAYGKYLASMEKAAVAGRAAVPQLRIKQAEKEAAARIDALKAEPSDDNRTMAEEAVSKLETTTESNEKYSGSDATHAKFIAAAQRTAKAMRASIDSSKLAQATAGHRAKVEAAKLALAQALAGLSGEANDEAFTAANEAIEGLVQELDNGEAEASKSKDHARYVADVRKSIPGFKQAIAVSKVRAEVAAHQAQLTTAGQKADAALEPLAESPDAGAFEAAGDALDTLDTVISAGAKVGGKDKAYKAVLAAASKKSAADRSTIAMRRVEVARVAAEARIAALGDEATSDDYTAAEAALTALGGAVQTVSANGRDPGVKKAVTTAQRQSKAWTAQLAAKRLASELAPLRAKIEAADQTASSRIDALSAESKPSDFSAANTALTELVEAIEAAEPTAKRDRKFATLVAAKKKSVPALKRKAEEAVLLAKAAPLIAEVEAADVAAGEAVSGLTAESRAEDVETAETAIKGLEGAIARAEGTAKQSKTLAKLIDAKRKNLPKLTKMLDAKKLQAEITPLQTAVETAHATVGGMIEALSTESTMADFDAAATGITSLQGALDRAEPKAKQSKPFAGFLASKRRSVPGFEKQVATKRREVIFASARAKIEAATEKVAEMLAGLDGAEPNSAPFSAAKSAVADLERVLEGSNALAAKDREIAKYLTNARKKVPGYLKQIVRRTNDAERSEHRAKVDAALADSNGRVNGLGDDAVHKDYQAALDSVTALKKIVEDGDPFAEGDKAYAKYLASAQNQAVQLRIAIPQRRVTAAENAAKAAIEGIGGEADDAAFAGVESVIGKFETVADSNRAFAGSTAGHDKFIAGAEKRAKGMRGALKAKQVEREILGHAAKIEAAAAAADAKVEALSAESASDAFDDATSAVEGLTEVLDAGEPVAARSKTHAKLIASRRKVIAKHSKTIDKMRIAVDVAAHRAKVDAARQKADELLGALDADPVPSAFEAASEAVDGVSEAIKASAGRAAQSKAHSSFLATSRRGLAADRAKIAQRRVEVTEAAFDGALSAVSDDAGPDDFDATEAAATAWDGALDSAKSQKSLAKTIKAARKKLAARRASIAKRKLAAEIRPHRTKIAELMTAATEKANALDADSATEVFGEAEDAVTGANKALDQTEDVAAKSKAFATFVAKQKKKIPVLVKQVKLARAASKSKGHRASVEAAQASLESNLQALGPDSKHSDYQTALDELTELSSLISGGDAVAARDPRHRKFLASVSKKLGGYRSTIPQRRIAVAQDKAEERVAALGDEPDEEALSAATDSVEKLETIARSNRNFSGATKAHKKFIAGVERRASGLSAKVESKRIEWASSTVLARIQALDGEADDDAFSSAAEAVNALERKLTPGEDDEAPSKAVRKVIDSAKRKLPGYRARIAQRRIEGATAVAAAKVEALDGEVESDAFVEAIGAIDKLNERVTDARDVMKKNKALAKVAKAAKKKAGGMRARVRSRRILFELKPHRDKIEAALSTADGRVEALASGEPDGEAFTAAEEAVGDLESAVADAREANDKNKPFSKLLGRATKKAKVFRGAIRRQRVAGEIAVHQAKIDEASRDLQSALQELGNQSEPAAFDSASKAATALRIVASEAKVVASKNKKFKGVVAAAKRSATGAEGQIVRTRVKAADEMVQARFAALRGSGEPSDYEAVDESIGALSTLLSESASAAKRDKALKKSVGKLKKAVPGYRTQLAMAKVNHAAAAADERVSGLAAEPEESDFDAAQEALTALNATLDGEKSAAKKNKKLKKAMAKARKKAKAYSAALRKKKLAMQIAPHRAKVTEAAAALKQHLDAIESGEPQYDQADEALNTLMELINEGQALGKKSKRYGKVLAATKKRARKYGVTLRRARMAGQLAEHRAKLEAALAEADDKLASLGAESSHEDYQAAEDMATQVKQLIDEGAELGDVDKKYRKYLAATEKRRDKFRGRIRKRRVDAALQAATAKVDQLGGEPSEEDFEEAERAVTHVREVIASNAMHFQTKSLKKYLVSSKKQIRRLQLESVVATANARMRTLSDESEADQFDRANKALDALKAELSANKKYARGDKKLKKLIGDSKKNISRQRSRIRRRQVDRAMTRVEARLADLEEDRSSMAFYDAEEAISQLVEVLKKSKALAKKDKKLGQLVRAGSKKVKRYRAEVKRIRLNKPKKRRPASDSG